MFLIIIKGLRSNLLRNTQKKPKWVIWLILAIVGQYTDKMIQKYVKNVFFFVRVVTQYGPNESNDSFGFFCVEKQYSLLNS